MTPAQAREVLSLPPGSSAAELDAAFRRRAWELHPDRGGDDVEFARLVEAQRVLAAIAKARQRSPWADGARADGARAGAARSEPVAPVTVESDAAMQRRLVGGALRRWIGRRPSRDLQ